MDTTDSNSLKRKYHESPYEPLKKTKLNIPTPEITCTPVSIIKNKRLRPKKAGDDKKTEVQFFNSYLNQQRLLQTAPCLKSKPQFEEKENKQTTPISKISLKQPQTHQSKALFFGRSLHVTGFVPNEISEIDSKFEIQADPTSSLSFGSYNSRILNYRLFTSPAKEHIIRHNESGL